MSVSATVNLKLKVYLTDRWSDDVKFSQVVTQATQVAVTKIERIFEQQKYPAKIVGDPVVTAIQKVG